MTRKNRIKKIFLLATLPLVLWLFFSQAAFWHLHVTGSGIVVEHSHPFKNNPAPHSPYQRHHHTDFEYNLLAQISNMISLLIFAIVLGLFIQKLNFSHSIHQTGAFFVLYRESYRLRGPPIVS